MTNMNFDDLYYKIIFEEEENASSIQEEPREYKYVSKTIAAAPGSFKPPHKGHWEMIMKASQEADKTIVIISNISKKACLSRALSKSNLLPLWKAKDTWETECKESLPSFGPCFEELSRNAETISYNDIKKAVDEARAGVEEDSLAKKDLKLLSTLEKYLSRLEGQLTSAVEKRKTSTGKEITPEIALEIFNIYAKAYNVSEDQIEIKISDSSSPVKDFFSLLKECDKCKVELVTSNKEADASRYESLFENPPEEARNECSLKVIPVETMISATDIRNNLEDIQRDWFPDNISDEDFEHIKELLS